MSRARDLAGIFNLNPTSGTTAQRPVTAEVGEIYYNGTTGKTQIYTPTGWQDMASGIPFGNTAGRPANPTIGQPYFNGQEQRLELYAAAGWQNIVSETPGVVSISGNYLESAGSGTISITGTNFTTGAIASAIGTNGVEVNASSTTVNSIVSVTAVFTGLSNANEPYDIKVTNTSNLFGLLPDALYINASPVWQTASGSLGTFAEQVSMSVSATATDSDSTISYALASGSTLPSGVSLNSSTGAITGTLPDVSTNTTYTFTINASDGSNAVVPRSFSFISNAAPVWSTASGSLGSFNEGTSISVTVAATDASDSVSYSLASGSSLPSGITLNSSTGVISGTLPAITSTTTYNFTINALDGVSTTPRAFSITSNNLVATDYLVIAGGGGGGGNTQNGNQIMGGGGAGGYRSSWSTTGGGGSPESRLLLSTGTLYTISVGSGGAGGTSDLRGSQGANSSISGSGITSIVSTGGGGGASQSQSATTGGSGGGGSTFDQNGASRTASPVQGFAGGNSASYDGGRGGGGGGAGQAGVTGNGGLGTGGSGLASDITGTSITRGGGGGGGRCNNSTFPIPGAGGAGGGGAGTSSAGTAGTSGTANTGGGGGAGYASNGGSGGSGVVILRTDSVAASTSGSPIYTNPSANVHIYQFNADGSITF